MNVNEIIRDSPDEVAQKMQKLQRENEDLRSKLTAAKEEMVRMFERREAELAEQGVVLGNLKEHQEYLMQMIDDKNSTIGNLESQL